MTRFLERAFVWAGGAMFVGSLSLTAWLYAIRFADVPASTRWASPVIDGLLLTIFALHHSAFAREPVKERLASLIPRRLLRSVYVWVASLLLVGLDLAWQPVGGIVYDVDTWLRWALVGVQIVGMVLIAQAVRAISALELAGIRIPKVTNEELQTRGVFRLVRHPLYFGWVLIVFGTARMTGDRLTFAVITTLYLVVAMPWEERSLEREFGAAYRRYKEQVRWKILPYVY
jgi:protein-S-isoprenylcysteine O-methyltransferase Ste14